jgi:hypothetical protein
VILVAEGREAVCLFVVWVFCSTLITAPAAIGCTGAVSSFSFLVSRVRIRNGAHLYLTLGTPNAVSRFWFLVSRADIISGTPPEFCKVLKTFELLENSLQNIRDKGVTYQNIQSKEVRATSQVVKERD